MEPTDSETQRLDLTGVKILVVEDHTDSRLLLGRMVGAFGASVTLAANGAEGLRAAHLDTPDLVLCDLMMPEMNGFEFIRHLREDDNLCKVRVIAVSALGSDDDFMRTWEEGFSGHLVKPIDMDIIEAQLRRAFWAHAQKPGRAAPEPSRVLDTKVEGPRADDVAVELPVLPGVNQVPPSSPLPEGIGEAGNLLQAKADEGPDKGQQ